MTNFDRYQLYMRDITSPQNYIDFAWYYAVAAFLQRRVWVGPDHQKLFPNLFIILVGEPGIGKGLVIKQLLELLKEHKQKNPIAAPTPAEGDVTDNVTDDAIKSVNFSKAMSGRPDELREPPLLIPMAANATSYEALVAAVAKATRHIAYKAFDERLQKTTTKIYTHASLASCLEELSSIFRKHTEDTINFMITAYDCGDYTKETKTSTSEYVRKMCVNFFAGTTPTFIESSFKDNLLTDGFSSRCWFIFANQNRNARLRMPQLTEEQIVARKQISEHLQKLTGLYGRLEFTDEAEEYLEEWWQKSNKPGYVRPNQSDKLNAYYSRKNIHLQKLCMAIHCGEDASVREGTSIPANKITLETVKRAEAILNQEEKTMHLALNLEGANPLHRVGKKMVKFVKQHGPRTTDDLLLEFFADVDGEQCDKIIDHLRKTNQFTLDSAMRWNVVGKNGSVSNNGVH